MNISKLTLREYKLLSCEMGYVHSPIKLRELETLGLVKNVTQIRGERGGSLKLWEYEVTEFGKELIQAYSS